MNAPLRTPVLLLAFNRPDLTRRVFSAIRAARPTQMFVALDGPREGKPEDIERCRDVRRIVTSVDWPCQVTTLFRDTNVGSTRAVPSGIDWFFDQVEEGIILEDDCLPVRSFFGFCQDLLARYRNDDRVMMVTGDNFQRGRRRGSGSYYFSHWAAIWGWATWRRAWMQFDRGMRTLPTFVAENALSQLFPAADAQSFWKGKLLEAYASGDSWDFPWTYTLFERGGLCAYPNVNLVSNIGFGADAVHATNAHSTFASIPVVELGELIHPIDIAADLDADQFQTWLFAVEQAVLTPPRPPVWRGLIRCVVPPAHRKRLRNVLAQLIARLSRVGARSVSSDDLK